MRYIAIAGPVLAAAFGVFTAYSTFQPELKKKKEEREGVFQEQHTPAENRDNVIGQAILSDIREAGREITSTTNKKGFAWGIRNALFGENSTDSTKPTQDADSTRPDTGPKK